VRVMVIFNVMLIIKERSVGVGRVRVEYSTNRISNIISYVITNDVQTTALTFL